MSDLISREYMKSLGATCIASRSKDGNMFPIVSIDELPSVQPRKGRWIKDRDGIYHCSCCNTDYLMYECVMQDTHYCPNCGADMREKKKTLNEIRAEYGLQPINKRGEQT